MLTKLFEYGDFGELRRFVLDTTIRLPVGFFAIDTVGLWRVIEPQFREPVAQLLAKNELPAEPVRPLPAISGAVLVSAIPIDSNYGPWRRRPPPAIRCAVAQASPIGFDLARRYAALYAVIQCGDTGHGELVLLERAGTSWRIAGWLNLLALG